MQIDLSQIEGDGIIVKSGNRLLVRKIKGADSVIVSNDIGQSGDIIIQVQPKRESFLRDFFFGGLG